MVGFTQIIVFNLVVLPRVALAIGRFSLAPNRSVLRLVHTNDLSAKYLYSHQFSLFLLMVFSAAIIEFNALNDIPIGTSRLGFWPNLAVHFYVIYIAWRAWDGLILIARGREDVTPLEERLSAFYPPYLIVVSVFRGQLISVISSFKMFNLLTRQPLY